MRFKKERKKNLPLRRLRIINISAGAVGTRAPNRAKTARPNGNSLNYNPRTVRRRCCCFSILATTASYTYGNGVVVVVVVVTYYSFVLICERPRRVFCNRRASSTWSRLRGRPRGRDARPGLCRGRRTANVHRCDRPGGRRPAGTAPYGPAGWPDDVITITRTARVRRMYARTR